LLPAVAALALLLPQQPTNYNLLWYYIGDPAAKTSHLAFPVLQDRLDPPKYSPKKFGTDDPQPYEFDWEALGYTKYTDEDPSWLLKFRIFSQERKAQGDRAPMVARMLVRLWDLDYRKFKFDHPLAYNSGIVDVYLCWGGTAGGEQRFDLDTEGKPPQVRKVNTIYVYDLGSFTDPLEMAREVAHEYGHAVLPAVGGFVQPEDWANGYLGEKLFLRWARDEMAAGRLSSEDVMGASLKALDGWVKKNVDPLVLPNATGGPQFGLLEGTGQGPMDAYNGLVLYADQILPPAVVAKSLKVMGSTKAKDYPGALVLACEQAGRVVVEPPAALPLKDFWVPLGDGKVTGAKVVRKDREWALIRPGIGAITLVYEGS
jgi:hypothetical protein